MLQAEMIRRSPLRILESSTHGGLSAGAVGVIAGPKGSGKTACLVHIATDQLFQDKHVIHVSFLVDAGHIVSWYEELFTEMARRYKLDCAMDIHNHIIRNRIIMTFRQDDVHIPRIERSIASLIDNSKFHADTLVIDGYDFTRSSIDDVREIRAFASRLGLAVWFGAAVHETRGARGAVPVEVAAFIDEIDILICLEPRGSHVRLNLLKDRGAAVSDLHLELDPHILLISEAS